MKFRTEIKCQKASPELNHNSKIVLLGSCFSEHIGDKFDYFKFDTFRNPFGILFNPKAIETSVKHCVEQKIYSKDDLYKHGELWMSLNHHSLFDHRDPEEVLTNINKNISLGHHALKNASHVIITLGTSWVYQWKEGQRIVGNCHKIPQKHFTKELLTSDEIARNLRQITASIGKINDQASFIFTVSPVRHLKDGFIENTQSKALLHKAIHDLKKEINIDYFPAYEIMMDDLRDYRYYKTDFVHPNDMAIDYIWNLFKGSWISEETQKIMNRIDEIQRSLAHLPFDPESKSHQLFLKKLGSKIAALTNEFPQFKFIKKGSD